VSQARFQKQQREKARRERAAAKSARSAERAAAKAPVSEGPLPEQATVLALLAALHERFDAGDIEFEEFEATKQHLVEDLDVR